MGRLTGIVLALFLEGCATSTPRKTTLHSSQSLPSIAELFMNYDALERQILHDKLTPEVIGMYKTAVLYYNTAEKKGDDCKPKEMECFPAYTAAAIALRKIMMARKQQLEYHPEPIPKTKPDYGL